MAVCTWIAQKRSTPDSDQHQFAFVEASFSTHLLFNFVLALYLVLYHTLVLQSSPIAYIPLVSSPPMPRKASSSSVDQAAPTRETRSAKLRGAAKAPAENSAANNAEDFSVPPKRGRGAKSNRLVVPSSPEPAPAAAPVKKGKKGGKAGKDSTATASSAPKPTSPEKPSQKERMVELADGVWTLMEESDTLEMNERSAKAIRRLSDIAEAQEQSGGEETFDLDVSSCSDDDEQPVVVTPVCSTPHLSSFAHHLFV
jgi:hypothetical protein